MSKGLKYTGIVIGLIIAFLIIAAVLLTTLVTPKDVVGYADKYVYQKTGHHLTIKGKAGWSFFPWIGFDATHIELSNPPGFGDAPLATIGDLRIKVQLMPLFRGKVNIGTIVLDNSNFNLITNKQGQTNFQSLTALSASSNSTPSATATTSKGAPMAISVASIQIHDANIINMNQQTNQTSKIQHFNLETGSFASLENVDIKSSLEMSSSQSNSVNKVRFTGTLNINPNAHTFTMNDFDLRDDIIRQGLPNLLLKVTAILNANMQTQVLTLNQLKASLANLVLTGSFTARNFLATPSFNLVLNSNSASVAELTRALTGKGGGSGQLKFSANLNTSGATQQALTKNLNGGGQFSLNNLALATRMNQYINDGIKRSNRGDNYQGDTTKSVSIWSNYTVRGGIIYINSLTTSLKNPIITGGGSVNLMTQGLAITLNASTTISISHNAIPIHFPIYVGGTISNPTFTPDTNAIAGQIIAYFAKNLLQAPLKGVIGTVKSGGKALPFKIPFFGN